MFFKTVTRSTFRKKKKESVSWLGGRSIWHCGIPLSLRGTQYGRAQGARRQMPNPNNKKKKKRTRQTKGKVHASTGAPPGTRGWHILDTCRLFLDKKVKDESVKAKGGYMRISVCVFSCLCGALFCCLSSLAVSACRQGAPNPGPESASELCPLSTSPSRW